MNRVIKQRVRDKVTREDERDGRESLPQPRKRLRGGKVTGRKEKGGKATGGKATGGKATGGKATRGKAT